MEKQKKKYQIENDGGITLVALVVTVVVLLILAGITLTYVFGDNNVFKQASDAKLKTDIANWQERLEMAKSPIFIEGLGIFNPEKYFDYIQGQGIINNKDIDVIDNADGTYDVTTKPGYVFLVTLMPTPENPTDAEIEYIGQAGKIAPIIKRLDVSATSTSITGKAVVARIGNGTIKYYYKFTSADDSTYQEITNVNAETGATQSTGITAGESYTIKVVAKNDVGEVELAKEITATKVFVESITLNKTTEIVAIGKTVTLTATVKPDDATNKNVIWASSNANIATVSDTGVVTGRTVGTATITAKTTDGSNISINCTVTVKSVSLNKTSITIQKGKTETLIATVLPSNASNKNIAWSSSDTSVATVDGSGVVTGIKKGTATITVSTTDTSEATTTCTVTIVGSSLDQIVGIMQTSNKTVSDDNENKVVVPGGFKVVPNGAGDVTYTYSEDGSPNVQDGVVIEDKEGNQFVWIPVGSIKNKNNTTTTITLGRYTFTSAGARALRQDATNYSSTVTIENYYQEKISSDGNTAAKNLSAFVSKTNSNGGFYFGRYEASQGTDGKVDTQADKDSWVNITQPDAATKARAMYSSNYVESDLLNSYSWDTTIVFIQRYSGDSNYANKTGIAIGQAVDKVCNIHDMASNCYEWSTEHSTRTVNGDPYPCVHGGGATGNDIYSVCSRALGTTVEFSSEKRSFRPILYLK